MADVAREAKVSPTTVSFVINDVASANISEETRRHVLQVIKELNYRPNAAARHISTRRSKQIGFIAEHAATSPFGGLIVKGAQDQAWTNDKILLIVDTSGHAEMERLAIEMMLQRRVEGIIIARVSHRPLVPPPSVFEVPTVLVNCSAHDRSLPSVVPDEVQGGRTATETLLQQGHRRIGVIMGERRWIASELRVEGYREALQNYEIPYDCSLVRFGSWWQESGYKYALELMQSACPPTALFCGNDRIAMGAYEALKELCLAIPGDVSVIGFDNQEIIAAHTRPRLTTVKLPYYRMGKWAVDYIMNSEESWEPAQARLACPLVVRKSVGSVRDHL